MQRAEHAADIRIGIIGQQRVDRVLIQQHIGIGENQHVTLRARRKLLHAMRFARTAGAAQERHHIAGRCQQIAGAIGRAVIEGQHIKPRMPRLESAQIGNLVGQRGRFVIGAEQQ